MKLWECSELLNDSSLKEPKDKQLREENEGVFATR